MVCLKMIIFLSTIYFSMHFAQKRIEKGITNTYYKLRQKSEFQTLMKEIYLKW